MSVFYIDVSHLFWIVVILCGLSVGSFLNVIIFRFNPSEELSMANFIKWSFKSSHCMHCNNKILKRDNIPILSWILLNGKCRYCYYRISIIYPLTEFITMLVFSYFYMLYEYNMISLMAFFFYTSLACTLYCSSIIDYHHKIIPDVSVFYIFVSGAFFSFVADYDLFFFLKSLMAVVIMFCILTLSLLIVKIFLKTNMPIGGGDLKLFMSLAIWLGWENIGLLLLLSSFFGLIHFVFLNKKAYSVPISFGPSISMSAMVIIIFTKIGIN